ncbi:MAG: NUDIX domain-containing protein [Bacteriovoracaceae bacterium]|nr:NUDIX domain-containing protein [Bacteriovoracaceae bacterium]
MEKKNILVSIMVFLRKINEEGFEIWTQKRMEEGPLFGKMEFPGGKIETGETPLVAVIREVHEEVGLEIPTETVIKLFKMQIYSSETKNICLYVHYAQLDSPHLAETGWFKLNYVSKSAPLKGIIPEINHVFIDEMAVYMKAEIDKGTFRF